MYDVIVIGAGPAGSSAARELASNGYSVLLAEKFKLPRNKSCSGILIKKSVDLITKYFGEEVPASVMCSPSDNRGMVFTSDKGKEYLFEQPGANIWRSRFDNWMAQKAADAGADLRDGTAATAYTETEDSVEVTFKGSTTYTETARMVIVCEGAVSSLKRKYINGAKDYITTYQTFNHGSISLDPHYFYAYLQPQLSQYDAWFNVKDDYLIFGVAVADTSLTEHYYREFISYMEREHNARIEAQIKSEKWVMPHIRPGCNVDYGSGRVLYAGEAAGFLNPMGEGISAGLESGYAAARAVCEADISGADDLPKVLSSYERMTSGLKNYMERQWSFVAGIADTFGHMHL